MRVIVKISVKNDKNKIKLTPNFIVITRVSENLFEVHNLFEGLAELRPEGRGGVMQEVSHSEDIY